MRVHCTSSANTTNVNTFGNDSDSLTDWAIRNIQIDGFVKTDLFVR